MVTGFRIDEAAVHDFKTCCAHHINAVGIAVAISISKKSAIFDAYATVLFAGCKDAVFTIFKNPTLDFSERMPEKCTRTTTIPGSPGTAR